MTDLISSFRIWLIKKIDDTIKDSLQSGHDKAILCYPVRSVVYIYIRVYERMCLSS